MSEGTKIDFQVEVNSYLYGTRFMSYLAYKFSPDSLIAWIARTDGSRAYYARQFRQVYGMPLEDAWRDWIAWEKEFQAKNLERIRAFPTTPYRDLSALPMGSVSRAYLDADAGKIYVAFNYPGVVAHVGAISLADGSIERIVDVRGPVIYSVTSLAWDPGSRTLFYTTDNNAYRDLCSVDPSTHASKTLLKDARIGDLAFDAADRSVWGIRHFNGIATLVRVPYPYHEWKPIHSWPYGEVAYGLDVSPDGRLLSAAVGGANGRHELRVMRIESLEAGDPTPVATFDFGVALPLNFVFSPDRRYLYGSSYFTGVSNIFRYDLLTGRKEALTNAETGFFRPIPAGGDSLLVFRYTGEGFVPSKVEVKPLEDVNAITFLGQQVAEKYPVLDTWKAGSPAQVPLESLVGRKEPYRIGRSLELESLYPVALGYKDTAAVGMRFNLSDPLSLNRSSLTASYTPGQSLPPDERLHLQIRYRRYDWRASASLNPADFYDLFGPTKVGLKGYSVSAGYERALLYEEPRRMVLGVDATLWGNLDRVPGEQNVSAPTDTLLETRARLAYSDVRSSLGHVDDEKGYRWEVVAAGRRAGGKTIPSLAAGWDLGLALPLRHSSVWLRTGAGGAGGDREDPFANFYFGGFGNNRVDHGEVRRYRGLQGFPGIPIDDLGGTTFVRTTLEWNLPPLRFRSAGTPGCYLTWARSSLFAGAIAANPETAGPRRTVKDVGAQTDLRLTVLSRVDVTLSLGYAVALEAGRASRNEFMFSLNLLHGP
ncbi:MAG: hypothetical protein LAO51_15320 [Acidobacteriia bacterium]|nr:hypothetical protein [Terriglobia bacterium]